MCEPITLAIASLAIGAGSAAMSHQSQKQQSKAAAKAAQRNYEIQQAQESLARQEGREAATQETQQNTIEAAQARSTLQTSAGSAGVSGNSLMALLSDINRQESTIDSTISRSQYFAERQSQQRTNAYAAQASSRINSAPKPSYLATGLRIGGAAANAGTNYLQLKQ